MCSRPSLPGISDTKAPKVKKLAPGKKWIDSVEEVLKVGDKIQVEIKEIDPRGKLSLIPVVDTPDSGDSAASADG